MSARSRTFATAAATVAAIAWCTPVSVAGQSSPPAANAWTAPRTPDGQPDIQGFWNNQGRRLATYDIEAAADAALWGIELPAKEMGYRFAKMLLRLAVISETVQHFPLFIPVDIMRQSIETSFKTG